MAGILRRALRGPRLIVLCYHRVDEDPGKPALSATPSEFARQLDWYACRFDVLPLAKVAGYLAGRETLRRDSVALTFDDGYADNYHIVLPLLNSRRLPATYFISTGPLLDRLPYWYDVLWMRLKLWNGKAPAPDAAAGLPKELVEALDAFADDPGNSGKAGLQRILDCSKGLDTPTRGLFLEWLQANQAGSEAVAAPCETMTLAEALDSARRGIELGGHTRSHPSLARIPAPECRMEILGGLTDLAGAGFDVRFFAYPFGESMDVGGASGYPHEVLSDLERTSSRREAAEPAGPAGPLGPDRVPGVQLAVTTEERAVRPGDDPFLVPRKVITPQDLSQIALKLELLAWRK